MAVKIEQKHGADALASPQVVTVTTAGNVTHFQTLQVKPAEIPVKRISGTQYVDKRDGEIKDYKQSLFRSQNVSSFYDTLKRLRDLINANTSDPSCLRWVTLTYRENMRDSKRLYRDFQVFWQRFKRWCEKYGYSPEYITIAEPQARGAWHLHCIFIFHDVAPFIPADILSDLWEQGFVKIKAVKGDNIGAYFSAYLTDLPLSDVESDLLPYIDTARIVERDVDDECGERVKKKFVKGSRVYLYPTKFNLYRHSLGVEMPVVEEITREEAQKRKASAGTLTFGRTTTVTEEDGRTLNIITDEYYNTKR